MHIVDEVAHSTTTEHATAADEAYAGWLMFQATDGQRTTHLARTPIELFSDPYVREAFRLLQSGAIASLGGPVLPRELTATLRASSELRPPTGESWETLVARWYSGAAYSETQAIQLEARLRDALSRRSALTALHRGTVQIAASETTVDLHSALNELNEALRATLPAAQAPTLSELADRCIQHADDVQQGRIPPGLNLGYLDVDMQLGGIARGNLAVVAARSGVGKTTCAIDIARHNARAGHKVVFVSLEMTAEELTRRVLSAESEVPHHKLRTGELDDRHWQKLADGHRQISDQLGDRIHILDSGVSTLSEIRAALLAIETVDLVVVDYLQLIQPHGKVASKYEEVSQHSRGLKLLAKELNVPVIYLAQLNREVDRRTSPKPCLADLRDSSAIESDADFVFFLYKEDSETNPSKIAEVSFLCAKARHGATFEVTLVNRQHFAHFADMARVR